MHSKILMALASVAPWWECRPVTEGLRVRFPVGARAHATPGPDAYDSQSQHGSRAWVPMKATNRCFSHIDVSLSPFLALSEKSNLKKCP